MHHGAVYQVDMLSGKTYVINGAIGVICKFPILEAVLHVCIQPVECKYQESL